MAKYRVSVPVICGHMDFFVEADSEIEAIEKVDNGEFIEAETERHIEYDFDDATASVEE